MTTKEEVLKHALKNFKEWQSGEDWWHSIELEQGVFDLNVFCPDDDVDEDSDEMFYIIALYPIIYDIAEQSYTTDFSNTILVFRWDMHKGISTNDLPD